MLCQPPTPTRVTEMSNTTCCCVDHYGVQGIGGKKSAFALGSGVTVISKTRGDPTGEAVGQCYPLPRTVDILPWTVRAFQVRQC